MPGILPNSFYQPIGAFVGGYIGPVDAVPGATHFWGLRAATSALIGANAIELRESGGNTLQTFTTIAGGGLDLAAIASFKGANSLFVRRIYDQIGTDHLIQTTNGSQPRFVLGVANGGTLPVTDDNAGGPFLSVTLAGGVISQPFTMSGIVRRTTGLSASFFMGGSGSGAQFATTSGRITAFSGTNQNVNGITENQYHSVNVAFNGASSDVNIDGVQNTLNIGTGTLGASIGWLAWAGQGTSVNTEMMEHIIYPSALSSGNSSTLYSNQRKYWGY